MASWEGKDASNDPSELSHDRNFARLRFPKEYKSYVEVCYESLQARRATLLSQLRPDEISASNKAKEKRSERTKSSADDKSDIMHSEIARAVMRRRSTVTSTSTKDANSQLSPNSFKNKFF